MSRALTLLPILSLLAVAACASKQAVARTAAEQAAIDARAAQGEAAYSQLRLQHVEQRMLGKVQRLTYGYAAVNCGLRSQEWLSVLRMAYERAYATELQRNPLSPAQVTQADAYAQAHFSDPTPPPYICQLMARDITLDNLDNQVATESLILMSEKQKPG